MIDQQILSGNWREVSRKLKARWGKLTDDELRTFSGNVDQLVGRIQQKTGESREVIQHFLDEMGGDASSFLGNIRDSIEQTTNHAVEGARESYEALRQSYSEAERVIEERPGQSVAVAFGLGLLSGLGLAILLRTRPHESRFSRARSATEHVGRQVLDALAGIVPDTFKKTPLS